MYLMYIDESGDTQTFQEGGTKVLVLTGCIIDEKNKIKIEEKFRRIKEDYYFNPDISFLEHNNSLGLCIIDPREGTVAKKYIDKELGRIHDLVRWHDEGFWKKCPSIIERVLFASSDLTVGIQISDLYCYPVFNIFEYDKKRGEYWRFDDVTYPKLHFYTKDQKGDPVIDGISLKFFPEQTKKDFRFYQ